MRRIFELIVVFLMGSAVTYYFTASQHDERVNTPPPPSHAVTPSTPFTDHKTTATTPTTISSKSVGMSLSSLTTSARQYLDNGQIDAYMQLLDKHRPDNDNKVFLALRKEFFHYLQDLKTNHQYRTATDYLTTFIKSEFDDVTAWRALAEFHYLQKNFLPAIDALYQAKSYAHNTQLITQISEHQRSIINSYVAELKAKNNNLGLLDLYQRLVNIEPQNYAYYLGLAQAYMALGNDADAKRTLEIIAYDPDQGTKAQQLLSVIENRNADNSNNAETIPLQRHGNNLIANVVFNDGTNSRLLLDTGASLTVITPSLLQYLGLDNTRPIKSAWFNTANGVVKAPIYRLDHVGLGSQSVDQLEVAVMELDDPNINGLLGMNFLQHFRFSIDHQHRVLFLSPRH